MDEYLIEQICQKYIEVRGSEHAPGQTFAVLCMTLRRLHSFVPLDLDMFSLALDRTLIGEIDSMWEWFNSSSGVVDESGGWWPRYAIEHRCSTGSCGH